MTAAAETTADEVATAAAVAALVPRPRSSDGLARRLFLRMARPVATPDPYPLYAQLRQLGPVVPVRFPGVPPRYLITTFAECTAVLRHDAAAPLARDHFYQTNPQWAEHGLVRSMLGSMAFHSGQQHRLERGMLAKHFSPRRVAQQRQDLNKVAQTLLDELEARGRGGDPVDIEHELSVPYCALAIGRLMGIPDDQALRLGSLARRCAATLELAPSPAQRQQVAELGENLLREIADVAGRARRRPGDDMVSDVAADCGDDDERLISNLLLLFSAGFDSPTSLVGLGLRLLLDNPEQAARLREDPALAGTALEEILRYEPPVQIIYRAATSPITVGGVTIPEGSVVLAMVGSATHDSNVFTDPDRFDVRRTPASTLSLGGGAHYCLGAHLARLSLAPLFALVLTRFPRMRLAGEPTYRSPGVTLRGFENLPVILTPTDPS
jgi:cytochrome P450